MSSFLSTTSSATIWDVRHSSQLCIIHAEDVSHVIICDVNEDHRITGFGKDSIKSKTLTKTGSLKHRKTTRWLMTVSREADHNISRQVGPVLCCPQSKEVLSLVQMECPEFRLCMLPPVLSLGTTKKSHPLDSLPVVTTTVVILVRSCLSLSSRLSSPRSFDLSSYMECSRSSIIFVTPC